MKFVGGDRGEILTSFAHTIHTALGWLTGSEKMKARPFLANKTSLFWLMENNFLKFLPKITGLKCFSFFKLSFGNFPHSNFQFLVVFENSYVRTKLVPRYSYNTACAVVKSEASGAYKNPCICSTRVLSKR